MLRLGSDLPPQSTVGALGAKEGELGSDRPRRSGCRDEPEGKTRQFRKGPSKTTQNQWRRHCSSKGCLIRACVSHSNELIISARRADDTSLLPSFSLCLLRNLCYRQADALHINSVFLCVGERRESASYIPDSDSSLKPTAHPRTFWPWNQLLPLCVYRLSCKTAITAGPGVRPHAAARLFSKSETEGPE